MMGLMTGETPLEFRIMRTQDITEELCLFIWWGNMI